MKTKMTGWKYYLPESGEVADDAQEIRVYDWQMIHDAEDAAGHAAEDEWNERDGWEAGVGEGPVIAVIDPSGNETRFATEREAEIRHNVEEIEDGEDD